MINPELETSQESLDQVPESFTRPLGLWHVQEQLATGNGVVALAGAGGDGGLVAEMLVRAGVREIRVADPEEFGIENTNRQAFCNSSTVGMNKAEAVAEGLRLINPNAIVKVYNEGVHEDNVDEFVRGADVVIDETEFTMHWLGVMVARAARRHGVYNAMGMNVGFAGTVTGFMPNGPTFESMLGLSDDMSLQEIKQQEVPLERWLPYVPEYADLEMLQKVAAGEKSAPTVQIGVGMAASMVTTEAQLALTMHINNSRREPIQYPQVRYMDAYTGNAGIIDDPIASHARGMAAMFEANTHGQAPRVSY